jgi:outer membrane protein with beta-barrel domain
MRRTALLAVLVLALAAAAQASPIGVGVGAFGGVSFPIIQDDVSQGPVYGIRVPVKALPMLTVEPYYLKSSLGDKEETIGGVTYTREGFDHTGIGVNAMLGSGGMGFGFYPYVGIGSHKLERTGTPEIKETAYNVGLGFGINAIPKLSIQVRGELNMIVTGDTSRKFANATVGVGYSLLP